MLGTLTQPPRWPISVVLLAMSVIGPLQQIRIGRAHRCRSMCVRIVFAAPLIGSLLAWMVERTNRWESPIAVAVAAVMMASGIGSAEQS